MRKMFKFSALLLCLCLLFSSVALTGAAEGEVLLGDVDGNGAVETVDARIVLQMASGIIECDLTAADMNGDGVISLQDAVDCLAKACNVGEGTVIPDKNGENFLSDDPNNEFIRLISNKYGIGTERLVAIYSVPDSGTNYVLQFKGDGSVKSPNTLERVYHIGAAPKREISYTGGIKDNYNCSLTEGILVFNLIKTKVMQQYPSYFTGV